MNQYTSEPDQDSDENDIFVNQDPEAGEADEGTDLDVFGVARWVLSAIVLGLALVALFYHC